MQARSHLSGENTQGEHGKGRRGVYRPAGGKERIGIVFSVGINVDGFDPLILEGMRRSLEYKAVAIIDFGVSRGGYWTTHEKGFAAEVGATQTLFYLKSYDYSWPHQ